MNTNNNVYTIVYTTVIVVIAAAILALAAMALKPRQQANIKAETISQMLTAAGFSSKEDLAKFGNEQILAMYSDNIKTAFLIDKDGNKTDELETEVSSIELQDNLKLENKNIAAGNPAIPVYVFEKDGAEINVIPCYGAGLWGPSGATSPSTPTAPKSWAPTSTTRVKPRVWVPRSRTRPGSANSSKARPSISSIPKTRSASSRAALPPTTVRRSTPSPAPR